MIVNPFPPSRMMKNIVFNIIHFTTMSDGLKIHGRIHLPAMLPAPAIICSHGLLSNKDGTKFMALAQHLASCGFVVVRYDHRGCGQSQGDLSETTLTNRRADLAAVSGFLRQTSYVNNTRIGLMGSSMGGLVSLWEASESSIYHAVVTWATPYEIRRSRNHQTKIGPVVLGDAFYNDLRRYAPLSKLKTIQRCMILHGTADERVSLTHAYQLYKNIGKPKTIKVFDGADHRFTNSEHRQQAIHYTANFFHHHLMQ
ncbi:conserved hypothetical protein [Desulfosarcina cetonica]|nr:conserved hypothetical protein [Desulfosarcina cetonica]